MNRERMNERTNERESEVRISYVLMVNDVSHWVEEELVRHPKMRETLTRLATTYE